MTQLRFLDRPLRRNSKRTRCSSEHSGLLFITCGRVSRPGQLYRTRSSFISNSFHTDKANSRWIGGLGEGGKGPSWSRSLHTWFHTLFHMLFHTCLHTLFHTLFHALFSTLLSTLLHTSFQDLFHICFHTSIHILLHILFAFVSHFVSHLIPHFISHFVRPGFHSLIHTLVHTLFHILFTHCCTFCPALGCTFFSHFVSHFVPHLASHYVSLVDSQFLTHLVSHFDFSWFLICSRLTTISFQFISFDVVWLRSYSIQSYKGEGKSPWCKWEKGRGTRTPHLWLGPH